MVSQVLFGETIHIVESRADWIRIQADFDGYEGWCQSTHYMLLGESGNRKARHVLNANWVGKLESKTFEIKIPFGSSLMLDSKDNIIWSKPGLKFRGTYLDPLKMSRTKSNIRMCAFQFLETPYLWGGKTIFGTDCSGFTQTVYKFFNIALRRDAWQQAEQGDFVKALTESKMGDLAFFENEAGRITHVGILLDGQKIIHASGKVRVDFVNEGGIKNSETGERTHQLALVKRYL